LKGKPLIGKDGQPVKIAKYTGLHALRHFYASWCINREEDHGLNLPPIVVQKRLGHANIPLGKLDNPERSESRNRF
jgi:integrase